MRQCAKVYFQLKKEIPNEHQKSYKKVSDTLQFVSLVNSGCTTQNYSLKNTTTSTDIFSVKSDSIITQIILHDNSTIFRVKTLDWERQ